MGFLAKAIAQKSAGMSSLELFREIYGGRVSSAGKTVNLQTALGVATIFGICRVIGNGMAQVPLKLIRETVDDKGRTTRHPARDHALYDLLSLRPNPWQTAFEFWQMLSWHVELAGNFYAYKNAPMGEIRELIPFEPGQVKVTRRDDYSLKYEVRASNGSTMEFPAESIWHVRGATWNGWMGLELLQVARDAIGLSMAIEEAQAKLHANGISPSGVYSVEGKMDATQHEQLRKWIEREHASAANAGKPLILDRAAKWMQTQMTGRDAQAQEIRGQQVEQLCRFAGIMPIMVGHSDKAATYASAEQMFLAHAVHGLAPRWRMYEQSITVNLLTEKERRLGLYAKFIEEGMIAAAAKDKKDTILGYVNGGILTPNEGRGLLDRNPDPDPLNDKLRLPVTAVQEDANATPSDKPAAKSASTTTHVVFSEGALQVKAEIHTPPVTVDNHMEPTTVLMDAPVVHNHIEPSAVSVKNIIEPAEVKVVMPTEMRITGMPDRASVSETERDSKGNIARVTQTEKDA